MKKEKSKIGLKYIILSIIAIIAVGIFMLGLYFINVNTIENNTNLYNIEREEDNGNYKNYDISASSLNIDKTLKPIYRNILIIITIFIIFIMSVWFIYAIFKRKNIIITVMIILMMFGCIEIFFCIPIRKTEFVQSGCFARTTSICYYNIFDKKLGGEKRND